jgi:hypothetical protein
VAEPEDRYVAAALERFASIALMFWYVLRLHLSRRERGRRERAQDDRSRLAH